MQIYNGEFQRDDTNSKAMGGTEILATELVSRLDPELLKEFQIVVSRQNHDLDPNKIRVYWAHDTENDPEAKKALSGGGYLNYHALVFVSNHQMQKFISCYNIPWSKCHVIQNAIEPLSYNRNKSSDVIKLQYWSTPHRGLSVLVPVFEKLTEKYDNIELDVFSSFEIYGWDNPDKRFEELFETCKNHPKINYHGTVSNDVIRTSLNDAHILAYPSIYPETSCLVLMEAMSAGLLCVHPNLGALYETAANMTFMYQWDEDINRHANQFYHLLDNAIAIANEDWVKANLAAQSSYANNFYSWNHKIPIWNGLLSSMIGLPRELPKPSFSYSTT